MKKLITNKISLALCGLLLFTTAAQANPGCHEVRGTVVAHLAPPAPTCPAGTISGVEGNVFDASNNLIGTTTACLTGLEQRGNDGALNATLTHTFIFTAGELQGTTIGTQDNAVLSPVAPPLLFRVNNRLDVTTGGSGFLRTHGTVNFANGEVTLRYNGRICTGN
ncbi:MAG TPA: hypothetical protein VEX64_03080 [Pyrinomonadaceae bacterium]|jgi:hypothetical protein|nr:hypothetical protein [Pyrinomonadaceae bacterium]